MHAWDLAPQFNALPTCSFMLTCDLGTCLPESSVVFANGAGISMRRT